VVVQCSSVVQSAGVNAGRRCACRWCEVAVAGSVKATRSRQVSRKAAEAGGRQGRRQAEAGRQEGGRQDAEAGKGRRRKQAGGWQVRVVAATGRKKKKKKKGNVW